MTTMLYLGEFLSKPVVYSYMLFGWICYLVE